MALVAFVLIVDCTGAAACDSSDGGTRSATCNCANGCATSRTNRYSLDRSAKVMPAMIPVINHFGHCGVVC
jgi:hypothetical protein